LVESTTIIYSLTCIFVYDDIMAMNPETFLALGEPNRFRIVELLRTGPRPVNDIGGRLGLRQSQVSQHLKVLKDVGLVDVEPRAQQRLYRLRAQPLKQLHKWLGRYRLIWEERFEQLDEIVEELKRKGKSNDASKSK
jgi:DNA-binding transcriptional ArsR family regulator